MGEELVELRRYCYLGNERAYYVSGKSINLEETLPNSLNFGELTSEKRKEIFGIISSAVKDDFIDYGVLAYAVALISEQSPHLKQELCANLASIFRSPSALFLFLKYTKAFGKQNEHGVWGTCLRKGLSQWYLSKDASALAHMLITEREAHGWSHKDVLKQIHFKAPNPLIDAVIKVFAFNKEDAIAALDDDLKALAENLRELKTSEDVQKIPSLLSKLKLTPSHIPTRFKGSKELWVEYAKKLPPKELLKRLEFLTTNKALSETMKPVVLDILKNVDGTKLDPSETYFALRRYESCITHTRKEWQLQKIKNAAEEDKTKLPGEETKKPNASQPIKACPLIVAAVENLMKESLKSIQTGNTNWLVIVDLKEGASSFVAPGITNYCASALLTQCTLRSGKSIHVMTSEGAFEISPEETIGQTVARLKKLRVTHNTVGLSIKSAIENKRKCDAILFISNQRKKCQHELDTLVRSIQEYRKGLNLPTTKVVAVFLKSDEDLSSDEQNLFIVRHFDPLVPRLIDAFSRGKF